MPVELHTCKYPFSIVRGKINPLATDFCYFKQSFSSCWNSVADALEAMATLLGDFAVPLAKVSGEQLVEFSRGWDNAWKKAPPMISLLSVLENQGEVLGLVLRPGQRYKGEGGTEAAAICIQSCWRRYSARTAYLRHCRRKWAARTIAISWLMHIQMHRVRNALQAHRLTQLENYRSRAQVMVMLLNIALSLFQISLLFFTNLPSSPGRVRSLLWEFYLMLNMAQPQFWGSI